MRKKYIDEFYETKDSDFYAHAKETLFLKSIQKQAKNKKFKILDIGCGSGELVIQMARLGYNIHAIDDAKNSIEYTEKRLKKLTDAKTSYDSIRGLIVTDWKIDKNLFEINTGVSKK